MKRTLWFFGGSLLLIEKALAIQVTPTGSPEGAPSMKPIKVSELSANLFSPLYDFLKETGTFFFEGFISLKDFVETGHWLVESSKNPEMREILGSFGVYLFFSFLIAFGLAQGLAFWLKPKIHTLLGCRDHLPPKKQIQLFLAALLSLASPLLFGFLFYTIFRSLDFEEKIYVAIISLLSSGITTIWGLLNLAQLFLKPSSPQHQHIPFSQKSLRTTYRWIWGMAMLALFGFFALNIGTLIRLPVSGKKLLLQITALLIAILAILMMAFLHREIKKWTQKQRSSPKLSKLKKSMLIYLNYSYLPLIVFIVMGYVRWVTPEIDYFQKVMWKALLTVSLLPLLRYTSHLIRKFRIVLLRKNERFLTPSLIHRTLLYGHQIDWLFVTLLRIAAIVFVLDLWGLDWSTFVFSNFGRLVAEKTLSIFIIIGAALFLTRLGNHILNTYLISEKRSLSESQQQRIARFKTISSVSRNALRIMVWTPTILLIITEMDIDIMPILATVGIISVGLSFGVQSLVKDLVTGFFMLLEDAFAVGDLVTINGQMGYVDSLTVRIVRLRATDGSLFIFPYGNITSLCNQNRDFSAAVLLFEVGIDANIEQVFEMIEQISHDLQEDPSMRKLIKGSVELHGVNELNDHAVEVRASIKTKPGQHYAVKLAFNRLLKQYINLYQIPLGVPRQITYNYAVEK